MPGLGLNKCGDRALRKTAPEARSCCFSASASGPGLPWSGARGPPPATGAAWLPLRGAGGGGRQGRAGVRAEQPAAAAALHARPRLRMCPGVGGQRGVGPGPLQGEAGRSEARRGLPAPPAPALSRLGDPQNAAPPSPARSRSVPTPDLTSWASTADQRAELRLPPGQGVGSRPGAGPWRVGAGRAQSPAPGRPRPPNPGWRTLDPGKGPPDIPPPLPGLAPGLFLRRAPSRRHS